MVMFEYWLVHFLVQKAMSAELNDLEEDAFPTQASFAAGKAELPTLFCHTTTT